MNRSRFEPPAAFGPPDAGYRFMPFRFMRWHDKSVLLTNESGEFEFLPEDTFKSFTERTLGAAEPHYADLKAKHFLSDSTSTLPVRLLATKLPEMAVATSCSKNFAVYRDRVGAVILMARDADAVKIAGSQALATTRVLYSMPPDHGAAAVRISFITATA